MKLIRHCLAFTTPEDELLGMTIVDAHDHVEAINLVFLKGVFQAGTVIVTCVKMDPVREASLSFSLEPFMNTFLNPQQAHMLADLIDLETAS